MDILKKNTSPTFQIVPRKNLEVFELLKFNLKNEMTQIKESILADYYILENGNCQVIMQSFPTSNVGDKISYTLVDNLTEEIISLGKILVTSEIESIQDYSKKSNNKFYN